MKQIFPTPLPFLSCNLHRFQIADKHCGRAETGHFSTTQFPFAAENIIGETFSSDRPGKTCNQLSFPMDLVCGAAWGKGNPTLFFSKHLKGPKKSSRGKEENHGEIAREWRQLSNSHAGKGVSNLQRGGKKGDGKQLEKEMLFGFSANVFLRPWILAIDGKVAPLDTTLSSLGPLPICIKKLLAIGH